MRVAQLIGFIFNNGVFTTIDPQGSTFTQSRSGSIGQAEILGAFEAPSHHGYLLAKGIFVTIDFPGPLSTDALGIDSAGQIVGRYVDANSTVHGFLQDKGAFTTIDPPGSIFTQAIGINSVAARSSATTRTRVACSTGFWQYQSEHESV